LGNVDVGIHRKPTSTDCLISLESCHPYEQKKRDNKIFGK